MLLDKIITKMSEFEDCVAIVTDGVEYTYRELLSQYEEYAKILEDYPEGMVFGVRGEFSIQTIGLMMALMNHRCIYVPFAKAIKNMEYYHQSSQCEYYMDMDVSKTRIVKLDREATHPILMDLKEKKNPGIIFFSSGTTGEPKAAVHDLMPYIHRFEEKGKTLRSMAFLLFDHMGGFNTVMQSVSNGGLLVTINNRTADEVCSVIEKYKLEVLPASPTFLHLLLIGRYYEKYDLSSLRIISYGTEPMPQSTLEHLHKCFPDVRLKQTYGLTELGVMRTQSKSSDSLWMKIGGDEHHQTKVVEDILYIKSDMAMIGYLNAEAPFDEEGWYNTGDKVQVDGEYFLIQGRDSERINVGGEKVYPAEVESVILDIPGVLDAAVFGESNPLMGQVVAVKIYAAPDTNKEDLTKEIKRVCKEKLVKYKRPMKIRYSETSFQTGRFKKKRS